jgi:hypothetical protein
MTTIEELFHNEDIRYEICKYLTNDSILNIHMEYSLNMPINIIRLFYEYGICKCKKDAQWKCIVCAAHTCTGCTYVCASCNREVCADCFIRYIDYKIQCIICRCKTCYDKQIKDGTL